MTDENLEETPEANVEVEPEIEKKTPKEEGEERLAKMLEEHPELKNWATFSVDDDGYFKYEFTFDVEKFDIAFKDYFFEMNHPDDANVKWIDSFYEAAYLKTSSWCIDNKTHKIDDWKERYTVRKIDEIEKIHYDDMTDEEKKSYDEGKLEAQKQRVKSLCTQYIEDISWRVERYNTQKELEIETSDSAETYLKIIEYMQYCRAYDEGENWWLKDPKTFDEFVA